MTVTPEMREAMRKRLNCECDYCVASAEVAYLAMAALDPEVAALFVVRNAAFHWAVSNGTHKQAAVMPLVEAFAPWMRVGRPMGEFSPDQSLPVMEFPAVIALVHHDAKQLELNGVTAERDAATAFLASQGYARGEDGTWGKAG